MLNTASLPDLIFTLLFFFMIVTQMRTVPVLTEFEVPSANELQMLQDKSKLIYIMVGETKDENALPVIQLNSFFTSLEEMPEALAGIRNETAPDEQNKITVLLKIDKNTPMGLVNDIRQILREAGLLTVYYSAEKASKN